uniref:Signal recognition particle 14 kDa protein n=1 Tax=Timema genevievae TaxID=629358 RepID=A0A7R9JSN8_TIMGE|nr:unnamed protein product [Timema genevievae]
MAFKIVSKITVLFQGPFVLNSVPVHLLHLPSYGTGNDGRLKPEPREGSKRLPEPSEFACLMRASAKNKKISTVIHPKDVNKFHQAYCNLLKGNLDGLKKLKKTKTKAKATHSINKATTAGKGFPLGKGENLDFSTTTQFVGGDLCIIYGQPIAASVVDLKFYTNKKF